MTARLSPTKPIISLKRLFSVGVRTRTNLSIWLEISFDGLRVWARQGKAPVFAWGARALSHGTHREERQYEDDYTKQDPVINKDLECACLQIPQEERDHGV